MSSILSLETQDNSDTIFKLCLDSLFADVLKFIVQEISSSLLTIGNTGKFLIACNFMKQHFVIICLKQDI